MPDVMCMLKLAPTITSTSHGSVDDFMKQQLLSGTIAIAGVVFNVYVYVCVCVSPILKVVLETCGPL